MAARRAREPEQPEREPEQPEQPASLSQAVEVLIDQFPNLAPPLAASLRALAAQLDRDPTRSPLWGRWVALLDDALTAWASSQPRDPESDAVMYALRTGCREPEAHRAHPLIHCGACCHGDEEGALEALRGRLMQEAAERGEDPGRYERMVPVGCARGEHRPHRWPAGRTTCEDCSTPLDTDGLLAPL